MSLGEILRAHRERRGLTQMELAERVGVDRSHVAHLERGADSASAGALGRLAVALELTPDECAELLRLAAGDPPAGDPPPPDPEVTHG